VSHVRVWGPTDRTHVSLASWSTGNQFASKVRFAPDSPLEEGGFEGSVPPKTPAFWPVKNLKRGVQFRPGEHRQYSWSNFDFDSRRSTTGARTEGARPTKLNLVG
jgi:hypothetical protein